MTMTKLASKQILIISSAEHEDTVSLNDAFVQTLNNVLNVDDIAVSWQNYQGIGLELDESQLTPFIVSTKQPLTDFKAVYFKSYFRYHEQATAIVESLRANNVRFVGAELQHYLPAHKLSQMARLARAGMPIPKTVYLPSRHYVTNYDYLVDTLGEHFIFKAIDGSTGNDNFLVKSKSQLEKIIAEYGERSFIAQSFVPNDSDLRFLIVGNELKLIIKRMRKDDSTHLNNTSQGADSALVPIAEFDESVVTLALKAAEIMNREIAGVDIMLESNTGKPYVLEVNASPQIASGAFEAEKIAIYTRFFTELSQ